MKKQFFVVLIIFVSSLLVFLSSCDSEESSYVDQRRIYTDYELFYNANLDITYARATFKFGNAAGTLLELSDDSYVTFNGDTLGFVNLFAYYEREYAGFVENGTFRFVDLDGNTYENSIEIHEIAYPDSIEDIVQNQSYEFDFAGTPLGDDENVSLTLEGPLNGDMRSFFQDDIAATSIILSAAKTAELGLGENTAFMDRKYIPALMQSPDVGGKISGRYRPVNTTVQVVE